MMSRAVLIKGLVLLILLFAASGCTPVKYYGDVTLSAYCAAPQERRAIYRAAANPDPTKQQKHIICPGDEQ